MLAIIGICGWPSLRAVRNKSQPAPDLATLSVGERLVTLPSFPQFPQQPIQVLPSVTNAMVRMVQLGLHDMDEPDQDRVLLGFFAIVVFGRGVTSALQNLRTFDKPAFDDWYEPWVEEMNADPLCLFFYKLRTAFLHGISPAVGVVLASFGPNSPGVGTITVRDHPIPTIHRGEPIEDPTMRHLCSLYVGYLQEMVKSATTVILAVQDRWDAQPTRGR